MRIGSLFTGYGGLDLAVRAAVGGSVAWHCEWEPPTRATPNPRQAPAQVLAHHYPHVPNHGNITDVDWTAVEPVDVLTGGFPCQDVSHAGRRAGLRPDTRSGLWTHMAYAVESLSPSLVVIENVRGLLSAPAASDVESCPWCVGDRDPVLLRALGAVLGDLADLGYDAQWHGLPASDVGAPHERFRVFLTARPAAHPDGPGPSDRVPGREILPGPHRVPAPQRRGAGIDGSPAAHPDRGAVRGQPFTVPGGGGPSLPGPSGAVPVLHTPGDGRHEGRTEPAGFLGGSDASLGGDAAPDPERGGRNGRPGGASGRGLQLADRRGPAAHPGGIRWGPYGPAVARWEQVLERPAPAPTEPGANGQGRLSPRFVEWMMGLPDGWVTAVPGLTRNEMLKCLGNGVVPQQAAAALRVLL